jgi:hypothetical protein
MIYKGNKEGIVYIYIYMALGINVKMCDFGASPAVGFVTVIHHSI